MTAADNPISRRAAVGVGLKAPHYRDALNRNCGLDFYEVHAENFMGAGGPPQKWLTAFREAFPITVHGVCLSIGGRDPLDAEHLNRLAALVARIEPAVVSEHLAWSADGGVFLNDLLPPPLTAEVMQQTCDHVEQVQTALKRRILIENPSQYLDWSCNEIPEHEFLNEVARSTGCGLLLDINNVFVSASNIGRRPETYIEEINADAVEQIHLAGHAIDTYENVTIRVDNHGGRVCTEVLSLYERFIRRAGPRPTLIEWDTDIPSFDILSTEAFAAKERMIGAPHPELSHVHG